MMQEDSQLKSAGPNAYNVKAPAYGMQTQASPVDDPFEAIYQEALKSLDSCQKSLEQLIAERNDLRIKVSGLGNMIFELSDRLRNAFNS